LILLYGIAAMLSELHKKETIVCDYLFTLKIIKEKTIGILTRKYSLSPKFVIYSS
jgi:hypothetical protein